MVSILGAVLLIGILLYMGMIYESTSLALLSCAAAVFAVLSLCTLLIGYFSKMLRRSSHLHDTAGTTGKGVSAKADVWQDVAQQGKGEADNTKYQPESEILCEASPEWRGK